MNTSQTEIQFPDLDWERVIIATKGLPCTGKSEIARRIGEWARSPVVSIDDFLDTLSSEKGFTSDSPPSPEEAEGLQLAAFDALCKSAFRHLNPLYGLSCAVIKSRLSSSFDELDLLIKLCNDIGCDTLIIIDCLMKNEHRFQMRLKQKVERFGHREWYKPRNRRDIEKARADCVNTQDWDLHLRDSVVGDCLVTRLVLDPFDDLKLSPNGGTFQLIPAFLHSINHLLMKEDGDPYAVIQFHELQRYLFELKLNASRKRMKDRCITNGDSCVFKYRTEIELIEGDCNNNCGVCDEKVVSGYTCHFCILSLHKSCAVVLDSDYLEHEYHLPGVSGARSLGVFGPHFIYSAKLNQADHACKSCIEGGKNLEICQPCLLQKHLKCKLLPTIINHDCHDDFLSIEFRFNHNICKACGESQLIAGYVCQICNFYYHLECIFLPGEVKHEHGGYVHVMKLVYDREGMEPEEDYWCDVCYDDMDPQNWFYSCQDCPYYVIHPGCAGYVRILEAISNGNLPIRL